MPPSYRRFLTKIWITQNTEQIIPVERHHSTAAGEQLKLLVLLLSLSLAIAYIVKG